MSGRTVQYSPAVLKTVAAAGLYDCLILEEEPEKRRAIPGKCPCGRTISLNKRLCRACAVKVERETLAMKLASRIPDREALEKVLEDAGERRAEVLETIRPYLEFPVEEAISVETAQPAA